MCIGLIVLSPDPSAPVLVLNNRDEFYARPTSALASVTFDSTVCASDQKEVTVFCGRDLERGGTWFGATPHSEATVPPADQGTRFGFLTNYREVQPASSNGAPSRGDAILGWLQSKDSPEEYLAGLDLSVHNGLNLVIGLVGQGALPRVFVTSNRGVNTADPARFEPCSYCPKGATYAVRARISPGESMCFAVSNGPLGAPWPKVLRLEALIAKAMEKLGDTDGDEAFFDAMRDTLGLELEAPLPMCLQTTGVGEAIERALGSVFIEPTSLGGQVYGTRSTTLLRIESGGLPIHMQERTYHLDEQSTSCNDRSGEAEKDNRAATIPGLRITETILSSKGSDVSS